MIKTFEKFNKTSHEYSRYNIKHAESHYDGTPIKHDNSKYEDNFYYIVKEKFTICDLKYCAKSERTFDIKFFDFAKNKELLNILNIDHYYNIEQFISHFLRVLDKDKQTEKLLKNPTLRILVQDGNLFLDVLEIFNPDDIRVVARKYNL